MHTVSLFWLAGFSVAIAPPAASAGRTPAWAREYMNEYAARGLANTRALIPAWARKYNMNCSGCHYPAPPRLNGVGLRFRWAGYRMPDEIGEKVDVKQVTNYLALRGRLRYEYDKTESQPASNSSFAFHDATVFYAGPLGKNYFAFFELEREAEDEVGLEAHLGAVWGKEKSYGGFRAGHMHFLTEWGVAGLDRPVGIAMPTPIGTPITASIPFDFPGEMLGVEAFYVAGRNRVSAEVLNGIAPDGSTSSEGDADKKKDFVAIDQFLLDDAGSGVIAAGYYGTVVGLDASAPTLNSHFLRLAVSANKIYKDFELLGGFVYGKDQDLPLGAADNKGLGYWFSGQYFIPKSSLTLFGRYEFVDPNTDVSDDGNRRFVVGSVLPVNLPEYLRLAVEYRLDSPQASGAPKQHSAAAEVMLAF